MIESVFLTNIFVRILINQLDFQTESVAKVYFKHRISHVSNLMQMSGKTFCLNLFALDSTHRWNTTFEQDWKCFFFVQDIFFPTDEQTRYLFSVKQRCMIYLFSRLHIYFPRACTVPLFSLLRGLKAKPPSPHPLPPSQVKWAAPKLDLLS